VLFIKSNNSWGHRLLGVGLEGTGKLQEAISEYKKAVDLSEGDPYSVVLLAHAWSAAGNDAEAHRILRDLERKFGATANATPYRMAVIYAGLGEKDKAFDSLNQAVRNRSFELSDGDLRADPAINNLRSDPRFQTLISQMGLPAE
jgi:tetratricopeptide (TPR) repeat protein